MGAILFKYYYISIYNAYYRFIVELTVSAKEKKFLKKYKINIFTTIFINIYIKNLFIL